MNDQLNQINRMMKQELAKAEARPGKSKKGWLWFFIVVIITITFFSLPYLLGENEFSSQGKMLLQNIKEGGQTLAAVLDISDVFYSSFGQQKNFLFLGVPGQGNDAPDLTDTIIFARLEQEPLKLTLISIPRDLWVKMPDGAAYTKINSLYSFGKAAKDSDYGVSLIKQKVEQITGQTIDYYILMDLSVVKQVVDELGGINIMVPKDIYDSQFPGPNHSFQTFEIKAGWRFLDGETATKYIRTRHSQTGDIERIQRQQQVMEAIKQKIAGLNPVFDLPSVLGLAQKVWNNIKTNISWTQVPELWQLSKKILPENIHNIFIDNNPDNGPLVSENIWLGSEQASILKPKAGLENYEEIQKFINDNQ